MMAGETFCMDSSLCNSNSLVEIMLTYREEVMDMVNPSLEGQFSKKELIQVCLVSIPSFLV